jgi:hypothetical protein
MSLGDMANEALKKVMAGVVEKHRKSSESLAVWRDGKVIRVPTDQLHGYEEVPESESASARDQRQTVRVSGFEGTRNAHL